MKKNLSMDSINNPSETIDGLAPNEQNAKSENQHGKSHRSVSVSVASSNSELRLSQTLEEVDRFVNTLSKTNDKSNPVQIPVGVEALFNAVEKKMSSYDSDRFGHNPENDSSFIECLARIFQLINVFNRLSHDTTIAPSLNKASTVLNLAVSLLDGEFRAILDNCGQKINNNSNADSKTPKTSKLTSFHLHHQDSDRSIQSEPESAKQEEFPGYSLESISSMNKIATAMVSFGYESECCMVYNMIRRVYFQDELEKLGYNNICMEDVQKMQWDTLESEIAAWNDVLKHCHLVLFPNEQKLCDSVFSVYPSISERLFRDLAFAVTFRFLNFAEAVAMTKRSAEKLFKFLDMYETLRDVIPAMYNTDFNELKSETSLAKSKLGEAAVSIFCELENSIRRDQSRTPVPSGAVHPLTRYTMNYLKYACEYKDTLEQVFLQHRKPGGDSEPKDVTEIKQGANEDGTPKKSPFSSQLNMIMDLLDENLEMKSKLYRDPALRFVFLMNNGRYILQKIKGSTEIHDIMGVTWCRKRSTDMRQYHKGYTRETWSRLLQCLSHEGLQVNGKVAKPVLKERFKIFNSTLEDIHKTQSTWVISDEQLQSELRVSISAVVIPAYRSFLGRFQQYLSSGRQTEKYIKYQPDDIENLIEGLFDGNPSSMARRRT